MDNKQQQVRFAIKISADDYLFYYQGRARQVLVRAEDGRRVQFPASCLQPFVTHDGISGYFELQFDASNKFVGLKKIAELS